MTPLHLYSAPLSMFVMKAHIAALEKGLDIDMQVVPYTDEHGYHPKHPDVLRVNPKHQVPILIHGDLEIFDSTQIFEYLEDLIPEPQLWPSSPAHRARARLLEHLSDEVFFPHIIRLMSLQDRLDEPDALAAISSACDFYRDMERQLNHRAYLAGLFTYADIAFFMAQLFAERMGARMTAATPKLMSWRGQMSARPAFKEALKPMIAFLVKNARPVPDYLLD